MPRPAAFLPIRLAVSFPILTPLTNSTSRQSRPSFLTWSSAAGVVEAGVERGTPAVPKRSLLETEVISPSIRVEESADDAHGAVFAAHGTGLGGGPSFFADLAAFMGVDDELFLGGPVEFLPGSGKGEIPVDGALDAFDDVGGVGGDLGGDEALPDVFNRGQAEGLGGRDVAEEISPGGGRDGASYGREDMGVARGDVGDERSQDIERRLV